jgi:hypothetical protein
MNILGVQDPDKPLKTKGSTAGKPHLTPLFGRIWTQPLYYDDFAAANIPQTTEYRILPARQ